MKKATKVTALFASLMMACCSMTALAACGKDPDDKDKGGNNSGGNNGGTEFVHLAEPTVPSGVKLKDVKGDENMLEMFETITEVIDAQHSWDNEDKNRSLREEVFEKTTMTVAGQQSEEEELRTFKQLEKDGEIVCSDETMDMVINAGSMGIAISAPASSKMYYRSGQRIRTMYEDVNNMIYNVKIGTVEISNSSSESLRTPEIHWGYYDIEEYFETGAFPDDFRNDTETTLQSITLQVDSLTNPTKIYFAYELQIEPVFNQGGFNESRTVKYVSYTDITPGYTEKSFSTPEIPKELEDNLVWFDVNTEQFADKFLEGKKITLTPEGNGPTSESKNFRVKATLSFGYNYDVNKVWQVSDGVLTIPADTYQAMEDEARAKAEKDGNELNLISRRLTLSLDYVNTNQANWSFDNLAGITDGYVFSSDSDYYIQLDKE